MTPRLSAVVRLRGASLLLLACLAVALGTIWSAGDWRSREMRSHQQARAEQAELQVRLARIDDDAAQLLAFGERYRQLLAQGYVGPERRLDWVEHIAQIKAARQLFDLRYAFAAQQPLDAGHPPSQVAAGGFEFMTSTMTLHLPLLHEDDLLGFLGDLTARVPALLRVRACTVERRVHDDGATARGAQLSADCVVDWITLKQAA